MPFEPLLTTHGLIQGFFFTLDYSEWGLWILRSGAIAYEELDTAVAVKVYFQIAAPWGMEGICLHSARLYGTFPVPATDGCGLQASEAPLPSGAEISVG